MTSKSEPTFYRWDSMKKERVSDMLERRLITGDRMMLGCQTLNGPNALGFVRTRHTARAGTSGAPTGSASSSRRS